MKSTRFIALLLLIGARLFGADAQLDNFKKKLATALSNKDLSEIEQCFYWDETPQAVRKATIKEFEQILKNKEYLDMYFFDLDYKGINPLTIMTYCSGRTLNGFHYEPNLKSALTCTISFVEPSNKHDSGTVKFVAIGLAPDGHYRIPGTQPQPQKIPPP